jgi:hypothetical protein
MMASLRLSQSAFADFFFSLAVVGGWGVVVVEAAGR